MKTVHERSPLRRAVKPVESISKRSGEMSTKPQVDKTTYGQVVKYTTHLPEEMVRQIKVYAVQSNLKDYEVVLKALQALFDKKE